MISKFPRKYVSPGGQVRYARSPEQARALRTRNFDAAAIAQPMRRGGAMEAASASTSTVVQYPLSPRGRALLALLERAGLTKRDFVRLENAGYTEVDDLKHADDLHAELRPLGLTGAEINRLRSKLWESPKRPASAPAEPVPSLSSPLRDKKLCSELHIPQCEASCYLSAATLLLFKVPLLYRSLDFETRRYVDQVKTCANDAPTCMRPPFALQVAYRRYRGEGVWRVQEHRTIYMKNRHRDISVLDGGSPRGILVAALEASKARHFIINDERPDPPAAPQTSFVKFVDTARHVRGRVVKYNYMTRFYDAPHAKQVALFGAWLGDVDVIALLVFSEVRSGVITSHRASVGDDTILADVPGLAPRPQQPDSIRVIGLLEELSTHVPILGGLLSYADERLLDKRRGDNRHAVMFTVCQGRLIVCDSGRLGGSKCTSRKSRPLHTWMTCKGITLVVPTHKRYWPKVQFPDPQRTYTEGGVGSPETPRQTQEKIARRLAYKYLGEAGSLAPARPHDQYLAQISASHRREAAEAAERVYPYPAWYSLWLATTRRGADMLSISPTRP